jgi:hypothetical protein
MGREREAVSRKRKQLTKHFIQQPVSHELLHDNSLSCRNMGRELVVYSKQKVVKKDTHM